MSDQENLKQRACVSCRYHGREFTDIDSFAKTPAIRHICMRPGTEGFALVTGTYWHDCSVMRDGKCGPDGRLFEAPKQRSVLGQSARDIAVIGAIASLAWIFLDDARHPSLFVGSLCLSALVIVLWETIRRYGLAGTLRMFFTNIYGGHDGNT